MVQYCVVPGCNNSALVEGISLHRYPVDELLRREWIVKIRRDEKQNKAISKHMRVCSAHFLDSDYRETETGTYKCLKNNAVPSVFPFDSPKKRRRILVRHQSPLLNDTNNAHVTAQMQTHRSKVEDALCYLDQVKFKFNNQPHIYSDFLDVMKEFNSQSIDTPSVIQRISNMFRGYPELVVGFNTFLSPDYRIEALPNKLAQHTMPETHVGAEGVSAGSTSLIIHPTHSIQANHLTDSSSENSLNKTSSYQTSIVNYQSNSNSQNQHIFNPSSAHSQLSGDSSAVKQEINDTTSQQVSQPVEFNFLNKVKIQNIEEHDEAKLHGVPSINLPMLVTDGCYIDYSQELLRKKLIDSEYEKEEIQKNMTLLEAEVTNLKKSFEALQCEKFLSKKFCFYTVTRNEKCQKYYTGIDNLELLNTLVNFFSENKSISYSEQLSIEDQLLLVLIKLRQNFDDEDLAFRFDIDEELVSAIFTFWIEIMCLKLGSQDIWPERNIVFQNQPEVFKKKYPHTVVILGTTELKVGESASLDCSSPKSEQTELLKGLIGCDPNGNILFLSKLYREKISSKQLVKISGFYDALKVKLQIKDIKCGDSIMVDNNFSIESEIQSLGLDIRYPLDTTDTHFCDYAICKVKCFKILKNTIDSNMCRNINQIWIVCCYLANLKQTILK